MPTLIILDTDVLSLYQRGHASLGKWLRQASPESVFITIVSIKEQMRGRLAQLNKAQDADSLIRSYQLLQQTFDSLRHFQVLPFDVKAYACYEQLKRAKIRVGTSDLHIAAIVLAHNALLITRNLQDFQQIPNLRLEDWTK